MYVCLVVGFFSFWCNLLSTCAYVYVCMYHVEAYVSSRILLICQEGGTIILVILKAPTVWVWAPSK